MLFRVLKPVLNMLSSSDRNPKKAKSGSAEIGSWFSPKPWLSTQICVNEKLRTLGRGDRKQCYQTEQQLTAQTHINSTPYCISP